MTTQRFGAREDYFIPGTSVLRNKFTTPTQPFGVTDPQLLEHLEAHVVSTRLLELEQQPLPGNFDYAHMKAIHRYLFQDVYEWAGLRELLRQMHHSPAPCERSEVRIDEMTPA